MQSLCTLRNHCRQWPRNTRYQADATPYLGRTSTGWIAPALPGALIHITDLAAEGAYVERQPRVVALVDGAGARTMLLVPMLKEGELVGSIVIYRQQVRPFSDKQIELVANFAAQAVIAIENTRLLNDLRQRTNDLSEALEQQTATSEVLQVISSSPGELEPVFLAMLESATRICEAKFGNFLLYDGNAFRVATMYGARSGPNSDGANPWSNQAPNIRLPALPERKSHCTSPTSEPRRPISSVTQR